MKSLLKLLRRTRLCALLALAPLGSCANDFINLDFEQASRNLQIDDPLGFRRVLASEALPGWTVFAGDLKEPRVFWNSLATDKSSVILWDGASQLDVSPIQGLFSVQLNAGRTLDSSPSAPKYVETAIAQMGTIPTDAKTLQFVAVADNQPFSVTVGGSLAPVMAIHPVTISRWPELTLYAADVSQFAGQETELRFTIHRFSASVPFGVMHLDAISFSPQAIPEPSTWALLLAGGAVLGWRCCPRCRR